MTHIEPVSVAREILALLVYRNREVSGLQYLQFLDVVEQSCRYGPEAHPPEMATEGTIETSTANQM